MSTVLPVFLVWFLFLPSTAYAAEIGNIEGKWGGGIRLGGSFLTQDINNDDPTETYEGNAGLAVNAQAFYGVSKNLAVGFMLDWNRNTVDINTFGLSVNLGTLNAVSLMPYAELRTTYDRWAPYVGVGLGININSFSVDSGFNSACTVVFGGNCDIKPDNTFAFKVSAGTDYFLTENLALNADLGWKRNSGSLDITAPGLGASADFNASVMTLMVGVRAYFK
jgi:opacity protein-like surface antigen